MSIAKSIFHQLQPSSRSLFRASAFHQAQHFSDEPWKARERAEEAKYFRKEDEKDLRKLLHKIKTQADSADPLAAAGERANDHKELERVLGPIKLPNEVLDRIVDWKHGV
jgi:hypothetical protein